jgi:hypothetical protein
MRSVDMATTNRSSNGDSNDADVDDVKTSESLGNSSSMIAVA